MNKKPQQSGSIYFITLSSAALLVVVVLGLAFLIMQYRRSSRWINHQDLTVVEAQLGVRHALHFTAETSNWRDLLNNGVWLNNIPNGGGTYTVSGTDPDDGDLTNGGTVELTVQATVLGISRALKVTTTQPPVEVLSYGLASAGNITISNYADVTGDVAANGNITKDSGTDASITGDVEVAGAINTSDGVSGTITTGADAKSFPASADIIAYYTSLATAIPYQDRYEKFRLSKSINPFGPANGNGVYKIDCNNQKVEFRNCRIVATLILINPAADSEFNSALNFQPSRSDYPALIVVNGGVTIRSDKSLSELAFLKDFSIPGELGFLTTLDTYPNQVSGLIYSTGDLSLQQTVQLNGALIAEGLIDLRDNSVINYDASLVDNPPVKFSEIFLKPIDGTWSEVIN